MHKENHFSSASFMAWNFDLKQAWKPAIKINLIHSEQAMSHV
jgi:hypothetical protein